MSCMTRSEIAGYIDHTLLKSDAVDADYDRFCDQAKEYGFKAVCVNSSRVAYIKERLKGTQIKVGSTVGFPLGVMDSQAKAFEASRAIAQGADELDMVLNVGALKSGDLSLVEEDVRAVRDAASGGIVLKVIIETCLLTDEEKVTACKIVKSAGADFVKTSTGLAGGGATVDDIRLMRRTVGSDMGVKASGGIRDFATAERMIEAGANRIGAGDGVRIVTG